MANPEHLEVVKRGPVATSAWVRANDGKRMDLSDADLSGIDLSGAVLSEVRFAGANLSAAVFRSAGLAYADFRRANLSNATLADISAELTLFDEANLRGVDLSGARLSEARFRSADMSEAFLDGARIAGTSLERAILKRARLSNSWVFESDFRGAELQKVSLHRTMISETKLDDASFDGSVLGESTIERASLGGASFAHATFGGGVFADLDLSGALGLETAIHSSPSTVGVDTIYRSGGEIPDEFLRGCGVDPRIQRILTGEAGARSDAFYEWSSEGGAIRLQSCFISFSYEDKPFASRLQRSLNDRGSDPWYAPDHGEWGEEIAEQIDRQISLRDRVVLICSRNAFDSDWVLWEIKKAIEQENQRGKRVLFPVMIDGALLDWDHPTAERVRGVLAADFRGATKGAAYEKCLERLVSALKTANE